MLNSKVSKAVRIAIAFGAASTAAFSASSFAAENEDKLERIEVTGSAIKRTDMEGALPVQVVDRATIDQSGATSVADLIQSLPSMQGFTTPSDSVGGGGGGIATASLRDLGASYTLVLLNGRRLAPRGSGSTIDLNTIPLAMIERVEILTDGASAIYGSDAIAGVVNFILKDEVNETTIDVNYTRPQESGGSSWNANISTGFGDYDKDGYNFTFAYSHDRKEQLAAVDRDFAKTGILSFDHNGTEKYLLAASSNAIPGNVRVFHNKVDPVTGNVVLDADGNPEVENVSFNPYFEKNGNCPVDTAKNGAHCWYDFTKTLEIYPESDRDSLLLTGNFELNDDLKLFTELTHTKFNQTIRIAPYPTGEFLLPLDSDLVKEYVSPYLTGLSDDDASLTPAEAAQVTQVRGRWRALPGGNRTSEWESKATHAVVGVEGTLFDTVDFDTSLTYSKNTAEENYLTGYPLADEFLGQLSSGNIDIFALPNDVTPEMTSALAGTMYNGPMSKSTTEMLAFSFKGSMPVFELPAGEVYAAFGLDYRETDYTSESSETNRAAKILFTNPSTDYGFDRNNIGLFTELAIPVIEDLEVSVAVRYDEIGETNGYAKRFEIGGAENPENLPSGKISGKMDDVTYKVGFRYQATDNVLLRGSIGTGFKAPAMLSLGRPKVNFGVTGGAYDCKLAESNHPLAKLCLDGSNQYAKFVAGNANLKPETSEQMTLGFVYSPSTEFGFTFDYWEVNIEDQVSSLSDAQIFDDPVKYADLFTTRYNPSTQADELAILSSSVNVGKSDNSGIDYSVNVLNELSFGSLATKLHGTYFIESRYTSPGTDGSNPSDWLTQMGRFGTNEGVTFRNVLTLSNTLTHGDFNHTLNYKFRSGYQDEIQNQGTACTVRVGKPTDAVVCSDEVIRRVPSYSTADYQVNYLGFENARITFGINNVLDKQPPLSLRRSGAGHQVGYDPRYTDVFGRTFYLSGQYSF
ncbi:TonB-dependent receptor [Pseudoalteromonas sp. NEC-BIFX-2020_002]|uniref:TonB-dependent receptor domain-containing protein n=1 Tax=Pseudoalteromonas sp. NEC-BIFX-2020_002 TaxID=2732353 RepID=UPI00147750EE|nr:TonB-dependent receptor [Pseudoalteromonas sp. NEC-BIFX-2020_002]NNG42863.1 TonB-dependent receptor [Pseudoalteromonas sp. NEC-BIFX-2020_002]